MRRERDGAAAVSSFFSSPAHRQRAFSLHEMLVVLTIAGILGAAGATLAGVVRDERLVTGANDLMAALNLARGSAIARLTDVVVCPSRNGRRCDEPDDHYTWWHDGYLVFVDRDGDRQPDDAEPVLHRGSAGTGVTVRSSRYRSKVTYRNDGMTTGTNLTFTFCPVDATAGIRSVVVSNTGRARVSRAAADHLPCDR